MVLFVIVDELLEHAVENCGNCEKSLNCGTDVAESFLIAKDLLDYESCHSF